MTAISDTGERKGFKLLSPPEWGIEPVPQWLEAFSRRHLARLKAVPTQISSDGLFDRSVS
jgi:hypothetical protein